MRISSFFRTKSYKLVGIIPTARFIYEYVYFSEGENIITVMFMMDRAPEYMPGAIYSHVKYIL